MIDYKHRMNSNEHLLKISTIINFNNKQLKQHNKQKLAQKLEINSSQHHQHKSWNLEQYNQLLEIIKKQHKRQQKWCLRKRFYITAEY